VGWTGVRRQVIDFIWLDDDSLRHLHTWIVDIFDSDWMSGGTSREMSDTAGVREWW
jgi:hypothetical protein